MLIIISLLQKWTKNLPILITNYLLVLNFVPFDKGIDLLYRTGYSP
jgi:hypothetical protein